MPKKRRMLRVDERLYEVGSMRWLTRLNVAMEHERCTIKKPLFASIQTMV